MTWYDDSLSAPSLPVVFEAPPHYYSLFGQLREARRETDSNLAFAHKVLQILLNTSEGAHGSVSDLIGLREKVTSAYIFEYS